MAKPNYGIDAPHVLNKLMFAAIVLCILGWNIPSFKIEDITISFIGPVICLFGILIFLVWLSLALYVLAGKYNMRKKMIGMINWKGDEQVLDIGTGRGLLMIAAAKKLTTGRSYGIDTWKDSDLSGNSIQNADINIDLEDVRDKVKIITSDARKITFGNENFDVILSLFTLNNIRRSRERSATCREIARVLKPGGTLLLADYTFIEDYVKYLTKAGLTVDPPINCYTTAFTAMYLIKATKP